MQKAWLVFLVVISVALGSFYSHAQQTSNECKKKLSLFIPPEGIGGFGKQVSGSKGEVIYCEKSQGKLRGRIALSGLLPSHSYNLIINGKPTKAGNNNLPGDKYGEEGTLILGDITTQENKNYDGEFESRKLKPGDYDVKFFVKDRSDWKIVLYNDNMFFTIK